jgi:CubicO group peptidase (beta-lactamase class C family)
VLIDSRIEEGLLHARSLGEVGVQVAAYLDGELIVDAWIGTADPAGSGRLVDASTLFTAFSVTKGVTAAALGVLVERGIVDYDARVTDFWPEYGQHGKERTTVGDVTSHRAGMPAMPRAVTPEQMCDWDYMVSELEAGQPVFEPGTTNAYHTLNWGWLVGEIVRRADPAGRPVNQFVREEVLEPLGITDIYLGIPADKLWRVAPVLVPGPPAPAALELYEASMPLAVAPGTVFNRADVRQSVNPGAGGIMSARATARLFAMLANRGQLDGTRLLSEDLVRSFAEPRPDPLATDETLGVPVMVGGRGYWLGGPSPAAYPIVGKGPAVLCSPGAGGSIAWADLDTGLSAAILHNMMHPEQMFSGDPDVNPFMRLADAIREVAAQRGGEGGPPTTGAQPAADSGYRQMADGQRA